MKSIKQLPAALRHKALRDADARITRDAVLPHAERKRRAHEVRQAVAVRKDLGAPTKATLNSNSPAALNAFLSPVSSQPVFVGPTAYVATMPAPTIGLPVDFFDSEASHLVALGKLKRDGIPAFTRLTKVERAHETAFVKQVEGDLSTHINLATQLASVSGIAVFEVDAMKRLYTQYGTAKAPSSEAEALVRAHANHALHPTATAVARIAFLKRLDELAALPEGDPLRHVFVTNGGCAAGKGALADLIKKDAGRDVPFGAVWDAAGEQEAIENAWVLEAAMSRDLEVTFAFAQNDPLQRYQDVLKRFDATGRVVDPVTFARSYVCGTENFKAFLASPEFLEAKQAGKATAIGVFTGSFNVGSLTDSSQLQYPELRALGDDGVISADSFEPVPPGHLIVSTAAAQLEEELQRRRERGAPTALLEAGALKATAKFGPWGEL